MNEEYNDVEINEEEDGIFDEPEVEELVQDNEMEIMKSMGKALLLAERGELGARFKDGSILRKGVLKFASMPNSVEVQVLNGVANTDIKLTELAKQVIQEHNVLALALNLNSVKSLTNFRDASNSVGIILVNTNNTQDVRFNSAAIELINKATNLSASTEVLVDDLVRNSVSVLKLGGSAFLTVGTEGNVLASHVVGGYRSYDSPMTEAEQEIIAPMLEYSIETKGDNKLSELSSLPFIEVTGYNEYSFAKGIMEKALMRLAEEELGDITEEE